jgi:hypothetical protein
MLLSVWARRLLLGCNEILSVRQIAAGSRQDTRLVSGSRWTHDYILLPQIPGCRNLEDQAPVYMSQATALPSYTALDNAFHFRRFLRLTGLRSTCSEQPTHGNT